MKRLEAELRALQALQEDRFTQQTAELGRVTEQLRGQSQNEMSDKDYSLKAP